MIKWLPQVGIHAVTINLFHSTTPQQKTRGKEKRWIILWNSMTVSFHNTTLSALELILCTASNDNDDTTVEFSAPAFVPLHPTDGQFQSLTLHCSSVFIWKSGRIRLDGTQRNLAACDTLGPLGVAIHRVLRVLICLACKSCFFPRDLRGHLKEHGIKVADKAAFLDACQRWGIHEQHSDVVYPAPRGPPVEVLTCYTGFACAVDPTGCAFACCSKQWMEKHVRGHPEHPVLLSSGYRANVQVQTLFPTTFKKFFEVEPALWDVPEEDVLVRVIRDFIPTLPVPSIAPPESDRERDALLRLTQWDHVMKPYMADNSKLKSVLSLKSPSRQTDPAYSTLRTAMQDYIALGLEIGRTVSPNLTVRKHLVQGRKLSSVPL